MKHSRTILLVITSLVVAVVYGLLCGTLTGYVWGLTHDAAHPGPLIPDNNAWGRIVVLFVKVVTGFCALLVSLIVSLRGLRIVRGGLTGCMTGLIVLSIFHYDLLWRFSKLSPVELAFVGLDVLFFPIGLTMIGILAALIWGKRRS